jgi:hypothetical protein
MADVRYSTYRDGEYIMVPPIDELCLALKEKFIGQEEKIEYLQKEIKKLESEHWKDNELQSMKKQYIEMNENYQRGFPISKEEMEKIYEWQAKHEAEKHPRPKMAPPRGGAIGGSYTYHFTPTSIGVFGSIQCSCGEKFTFQEEA